LVRWNHDTNANPPPRPSFFIPYPPCPCSDHSNCTEQHILPTPSLKTPTLLQRGVWCKQQRGEDPLPVTVKSVLGGPWNAVRNIITPSLVVVYPASALGAANKMAATTAVDIRDVDISRGAKGRKGALHFATTRAAGSGTLAPGGRRGCTRGRGSRGLIPALWLVRCSFRLCAHAELISEAVVCSLLFLKVAMTPVPAGATWRRALCGVQVVQVSNSNPMVVGVFRGRHTITID
jgi:hypothetical protein